MHALLPAPYTSLRIRGLLSLGSLMDIAVLPREREPLFATEVCFCFINVEEQRTV